MAARARFPLLSLALLVAAVWLYPRDVHACGGRALALEDLVRESGLIVVGRVRAIDERAGVKLGQDPLTLISVDVEQVLRGEVPSAQLSLRMPVGYLPDGTILGRSDTPELSAGDRYVLFLRSADELSPIVSARDAILRIVTFEKRSIVVDDSGRAILASRAHGLMHLGRVAASIEARVTEQLRDGQVEGGVEPTSKPLAMGDAAYASDAEAVLSLIASVIASVDAIRAGESSTNVAIETVKP